MLQTHFDKNCKSIKMFTDGSKLDDRAGNGIYTEKPGDKPFISLRNRDSSSVFKSELIAIKHGLKAIECDFGDLWILSDSHSSLQHLYNWIDIGDQTSISIHLKLKLISEFHDVHFQWIPSHVGICGNERADELAKEGCFRTNPSSSTLTFLEHQSIYIPKFRRDESLLPAITGTRAKSQALHSPSIVTEPLEPQSPD